MASEVDQAPQTKMIHVWALRGFLLHLAVWLAWAGLAIALALGGNPLVAAFLIAGLALSALASSYVWAFLYRRFYRWRLGGEEMHVWRGILFQKRVTIPYMRVQNVNVVRGPLLRMFGLSSVEVETAGGRGLSYGVYRAEGFLPGVTNGERLADFVVENAKRAKAKEGL